MNGATGGKPTIVKADADEHTSHLTMGMTTENIANNSNGYITTDGLVRGINTSGVTVGSHIFLSATAGEYTAHRPAAPVHSILIGHVVAAHASEGVVLVDMVYNPDMVELSDVDHVTPTVTGQRLQWNNATSRWELVDGGTGGAECQGNR